MVIKVVLSSRSVQRGRFSMDRWTDASQQMQAAVNVKFVKMVNFLVLLDVFFVISGKDAYGLLQQSYEEG